MEVDRRKWLKHAGTGGAILLVGGTVGIRFAQQAYARSSLHKEMMSEALPLITEKAAKELDSLPTSARKQIQGYFVGICLNVHSFVTEICSEKFAERLRGCASENQKHQVLNVTFSQKVVTGVEVLNRVETIAKEAGAELDRNWTTCCGKLADSWNVVLRRQRPSAQALDISALVEPLIRENLDKTRQAVYPVGQRPALSQTIEDVGRSAILLLAVEVSEPELAFPVFVVVALTHLWQWVLGQLANQAADYQTAITDRLAQLGNRVGAEFELEFRRRISDLQHFQEESLSAVARQKADDIIPAIF